MELQGLEQGRYDIGRAAIFYAPTWDGSSDLFAAMEPFGYTEGPLEIEANEEYSDLTLEVTGPAILKRYLSGESPSFELGVFPTPEVMARFSPTGRASAGTMRRNLVQTHTLWIGAEELFLADDGTGRKVQVPFTYSGGVFLKDGEALTVEEQELADMSILMWKVQVGRIAPRYAHEDGGKSLRTVPFQVLQDLTKPDGCQLYLVMSEMDDYEYDLDLEGAGS
jgi:hypothetical protein